jgi:hypothetical protein
MWYTTPEGERLKMTPMMSTWYNMYVANPDLDNDRFHFKFRRRFRMPYASYKELVSMANDSELFQRWAVGAKNSAGNPSSPLSVLILCALRYLGRGWTFDDLEEATAISEEVIRVFFHRFIEWGSTFLFEKYIPTPVTAAEAECHLHEFGQAGFQGCIGSTDATHITMEKISQRLRHAHKGFKKDCAARTYNITVNHCRRILYTTSGHPARWNDKTLVLFDDLMREIYHGGRLDDLTFTLYEEDSEGNVVEVTYRGPWVIADNGYLRWSTMIPPMKTTTSYKETRFSQWLESLRKDVECTFGILKGRWRVLKTGIRLHSVKSCDNIWKTCCALHNMISMVLTKTGRMVCHLIGKVSWANWIQRIFLPQLHFYTLLQRSEILIPREWAVVMMLISI